MDVDSMLNLERRTGIKNEDIDDFERKASEVQAAIKGLMDGTLKPEDVKVEGIEGEEEKQKKETERAEKRKQYLEKEEKLRVQRKEQEREKWWSGVEAFRPKPTEDNAPSMTIEEEENKSRQLSRYTADYSKWEQWEPTDEASIAEQEEMMKLEEERKNQEFEKNNPEFCKQFMTDMEERKKASQKKQESADVLRLKGNRYFKAKDFDRALELYMDALKSAPFDTKLLLNIAQSQIKLKNYEDASEFLSRTLYLEPGNVKALSRKAFVQGERGEVNEALSSLVAALGIEPQNADLLAQQKELTSILKELAQEKKLNINRHDNMSIHSSSDKLITGDESKKESMKEPYLLKIDKLLKQLTEGEGKKVDFNVLETNEEVLSLQRVYFRQSTALTELINHIKCIFNYGKESSDDLSTKEKLGDAFTLLAKCIDQQRSSKLVFLEAKLYPVCKQILSSFSLSSLSLTNAVLMLLYNLVYDDHGCAKAKQLVLQDVQIYPILSAVLGNGSNIAYNSSKTMQSEDVNKCIECIEKVLSMKKIMSNEKSSQDVYSNMHIMSIASLVCSVGSALYVIMALFVANKVALSEERVDDLVEKSMACLLGMSQKESVRIAFTYPLPLDHKDGAKAEELSTIKALLDLAKAFPHQLVNVIAILMNASLPPKDSTSTTSDADRLKIIQEIYKQGGLDITLLSSNSYEQNEDVFAVQKRVRQVGLLSRLAILHEVQQRLLTAESYRILSHNLWCLTEHLTISNTNLDTKKWVEEERATYVRILASLPLASHSNSSSLLSIGREEHVLESLLAIFPTPRTECLEITPSSVVLMPHEPVQTILLGNAARCFIPYIDDPASSKVLFAQKKYIAVEKMVCAMASCTDMRVRKNIAILLAKACKGSTEVRERVSYFRGLQMMIELQNQL